MKFKRNNSYYETWGETDGFRRDKRRCRYFNKGYCSYYERKCFCSSHCDAYDDSDSEYYLDLFFDEDEKPKNKKKKGAMFRTIEEVNANRRVLVVVCEVFAFATGKNIKFYISDKNVKELSDLVRLSPDMSLAEKITLANVNDDLIMSENYKFKLLSKEEKEFIRKWEEC